MRHLYCLPWPPSANKQYVNRAATVKAGPKAGKKYMARMRSAESIAYRQEVARAVRLGHQVPPKLSGRLDIIALACPPEASRIRDLDNFWKILLDSLKEAGVITDDSLFDHHEMFRGTPVAGGRMLVAISAYDPDAAIAELKEVGLEVGVGGLFDKTKEPF